MEFRDGDIDGVTVEALSRLSDDRGWLVELFRDDRIPEAEQPVMAYVSETLPGVVRGPHEHREQTDIFAFIGPGDFKLYLWDTRPESPTRGNRRVLVVGESNCTSVRIPPGVVHAYANVSDRPGLVFNSPNRLYAGKGRKGPVDEIRYESLPGSPYQME